MILTPAQRIIAADRHRFRVVNCGRRFGKTTLAVEEIKGKVLSSESRIAYIAPTHQQARDIAWEMLRRELAPLIISSNETRLELKVLTAEGDPNKFSTVVLRGWESIETLRGQKFHFLVLDEVSIMKHFWTYWEETLRPTLTDTAGEAMFISTPRGFDHFYDLFNRQNDPKRGKDFKSFHFTTYDNPFISVAEIDEAKREMVEDRFAQEYMADFRKTQGLVYKEFSRDRHIFDECPRETFLQTMLGIDFGFTNPCAILYIKRDYDNTYWVFSEWYRTKQSNRQIAEQALTFTPNLAYPDPEAPEKVKELEEAGLNVQEVNKGAGSIVKGIDLVRELFKQNRIRVHSSCLNFIAELETYRYPDRREDHNESELPVKENDHACDALRYAISMNCPPLIIGGAPKILNAKPTYEDIYSEL